MQIFRTNSKVYEKAIQKMVEDILTKNPEEIDQYIKFLSSNIDENNRLIEKNDEKMKKVASNISKIISFEFSDKQITIYMRVVSLVTFVAGAVLGITLSDLSIMKIVNGVLGAVGTFLCGSIAGAFLGSVIESKPISYAYNSIKENILYKKYTRLRMNVLLDSYAKDLLTKEVNEENNIELEK